jgi:hypothetical protein
LISFDTLHSKNEFILDRKGRVLDCAYPEKLVKPGAPYHVLLKDVLLKKDIKRIYKAMEKALTDKKRQAVKFSYKAFGRIRHKFGFIHPYKNNCLLFVIQLVGPIKDRRKNNRRAFDRRKDIIAFPTAKKKHLKVI